MGNLIRAELYRIRQRKITVGLLTGLVVILPLLLVLMLGLEFGDMIQGRAGSLAEVLKYSLGIGIFFAIPCAVVAFSDQYSHGTLINEAVFGVPRIYMYLSRLAAAAVLGIYLAAVCFASVLVFALMFYPDRVGTLIAMAELLPWVTGALPIWIASAAVCLCFEFMFRSDRTTVVLYSLYLTFGYVLLGSFVAARPPAEGLDIWGHIHRILLQLNPMTPFLHTTFMASSDRSFTSPVYMDGTWLTALRCWLLGLLIVAISSGIVWLVLRRRELRS